MRVIQIALPDSAPPRISAWNDDGSPMDLKDLMVALSKFQQSVFSDLQVMEKPPVQTERRAVDGKDSGRS